MKKKLLIILSIIVLFIGGYFALNEFKKKRLVDEAQEKAEVYLIENYENVENVHIDKEYYNFAPMGGISVGGHVNNKDHLTFNISFFIDNNEVGEVISIVEAPDFPDRKNEDEKKRMSKTNIVIGKGIILINILIFNVHKGA